MKRLMLALFMTALGLAASAGTSAAAFTVTVAGAIAGGSSNPQTGTGLGGTINFNVSAGGITVGGSASASEPPAAFAPNLASTVNFTNLSGVDTGPITVTIVQDVYTPLAVGANVGFTLSALTQPGSPAVVATGVTGSTDVTGMIPMTPVSFGTIGGGISESFLGVVGEVGTGAFTITHMFMIDSLLNQQTFQFNANTTLQAVAVPVPATVLAAVGCLPLLGFAGARRRRVLGA